jgi:hypothetical protein
MGGSGAPMFAIRHADRIAWATAWVGVHIPEKSPTFKSSYANVYGPVEWGVKFEDGTPVWDYFNDAWFLRKYPQKEVGLICFSNGKNDGGIGWPHVVDLAKALQEARQPHGVVWRMAGRVHRRHVRISRRNRLAVGDRGPLNAPAAVPIGPRHLEERHAGHAPGNRRSARAVIGVAVRDQDPDEHRVTERGVERLEVTGVTDSGVDEGGHTSGNEPGRVAPAGHRAGVEGVQSDRLHRNGPASIEWVHSVALRRELNASINARSVKPASSSPPFGLSRPRILYSRRIQKGRSRPSRPSAVAGTVNCSRHQPSAAVDVRYAADFGVGPTKVTANRSSQRS